MDQESSANRLYVKSDSVINTDETAGKLTVYAGVECTGTKKMGLQIGALNIYVVLRNK